MLGAERLVYGRLGSGAQAAPFTLRIDATLTPPKVGDELRLAVPAERLHWFDGDGRRVQAA
jgi:sn-glycerol 3-phosphate transport system ATP-binding protein